MITPEYVVAMARYNAWQNRQLRGTVEAMDDDALQQDRGAFFGSILSTLNHILWADQAWMMRLAGWDAPPPAADHATITGSGMEWATERFRVDGRILLWAEGLRAVDLAGPLEWYSGMTGRTMKQDLSTCAVHMFNHQTHHRGQVHAMLTAAGAEAPVTDLVFMPEEGPWP